MFQEINELRTLRKEKKELLEKESRLSAPRCSDPERIPYLYEVFRQILQEENLAGGRKSRHKRQFIFIMLYLYSPSTLAGGKIANGIRDQLSRIFGFKSPTAVSNICCDLVFWYTMYKDFQRETDLIYTRLCVKGGIESNLQPEN